MNLFGQMAGTASAEYGAATLLLAAASMASPLDADGNFTFYATNEQIIALAIGLNFVIGIVNSLPTWWMAKLTNFYVAFGGLTLISCLVALLVLTEDKHTAAYVFTDVQSSSGWTPTGWSFLFGFLSASWTMTDYDATAHICEE